MRARLSRWCRTPRWCTCWCAFCQAVTLMARVSTAHRYIRARAHTHLRCLFYFSVLLQCESRSVCAGGSYCDSSHAGVSDPVTGPLVLHLSSDVQRVPAQASAHPLHRTVRSPALLTCLFFFVLFPYFLTALLISILNF